MKQNYKLLLLLLIFLFSGFFSACGNIEFNIDDTIKPPVNENVTIAGTWRINKFISIIKDQNILQESYKIKQEIYVGKEAIFDNEIGAVGRDVCINPKYKIIRTSADTFLQNKYRIDKESLGIQKENVNVVTITSDNQLFYQLIVTDEMTAYVFIEDGFLELNKMSDTVDEKIKASSFGNVGMNIDNGEFKEDPLLRSGVLIGIRSADNTYRTLWIYSKNREIKAISHREQLIVPRAKGFWEIGTIKSKSDNKSIFAEPFVDAALQENSQSSNKINLLTSDTKILFVGNDYFGIEQDLKLNVLSIDNIREGKGVAFSDIINGSSYNAFEKASEAFISALDRAKNIIREPKEENFTLKRRNGHWIMESRLYYKEPVQDKKYEDFELNLIVPSKLILYDEMNIPWTDIKAKLPWITDAYMSPNKDIAILVSSDSLNIYPVKNKSIINKLLMKIPLSKADSIIMTEWSIGKYADIWAKFVDKIFTDDPVSKMNY
ncbi:MAG: hypothetical protein ACYDG2_08570 [Ruminiclostridium sp.]